MTIMKSLIHVFLLLSFVVPRKLIPQTRFGDRFLSWRSFVKKHKRLPTKNLFFNDFLYHIKTTNEMLNPLRVFVTDKEFLKLYVKSIVGDQFNVPTIALLNSIEEVDFFPFPAQCCIKPTHASGKVILRKKNEAVDLSEIKKWFSINYYEAGREANYKTLKPKVIVEPLIFDNIEIEDYKFFCFNGKVGFIQVDINRRSNHKRKFFDRQWRELDFSIKYPKSLANIDKPKNFDEMLKIAEALSQPFSLIRVDLYSNGINLYVGELTNCHGKASERFIPHYSELYASELLFKT